MEQPTPKRAWSRPATRALTSPESRADELDVAVRNAGSDPTSPTPN